MLSERCINVVFWPKLQRCHNVVTTLVEIGIETLRQHSGNVVWMLWWRCSQCWERPWDNVQKRLCECCGNIALNIGEQHSHNVQATLCEHCLNVDAQLWGLTFTQPLGNVVRTLSLCQWPTSGTDIHTTFRQCWVNVVSMLVPNIVPCWFRARMTVTFKF